MQLLRNTAVQDKINDIKSKVDEAKDEINELRVVQKINVIGGIPKSGIVQYLRIKYLLFCCYKDKLTTCIIVLTTKFQFDRT